MKASNRESQRALCEDVLAQARQQAEQVIRSARQEAEALLAKAAAEAEAARQQRLDLAQAQAAHRRELLLASVPLEVSRLRAARVETLLHSIHATVRQRLLAREGFDYRQALIALAAEAVRQMWGEVFVVKLSTADLAALREGLAEAIAHRAGRATGLCIQLAADPSITEGGVLIQDSEGHQVWDNRLLVRLERLWPELRRGIVAGAALEGKESAPGGGA
jgi:vacuolar-type H+-ATPase subunit E/Vma4